METIKEILKVDDCFSRLTQHGITSSVLNYLIEKYSGKVEEHSIFNKFTFYVNGYECKCFLFNYVERNVSKTETKVIIDDLRISINGRGCYMPLFNIASSFGAYHEEIEQIGDRFFNFLEIKSEIHPKVESDIDELFCLDYKPHWIDG